MAGGSGAGLDLSFGIGPSVVVERGFQLDRRLPGTRRSVDGGPEVSDGPGEAVHETPEGGYAVETAAAKTGSAGRWGAGWGRTLGCVGEAEAEGQQVARPLGRPVRACGGTAARTGPRVADGGGLQGIGGRTRNSQSGLGGRSSGGLREWKTLHGPDREVPAAVTRASSTLASCWAVRAKRRWRRGCRRRCWCWAARRTHENSLVESSHGHFKRTLDDDTRESTRVHAFGKVLHPLAGDDGHAVPPRSTSTRSRRETTVATKAGRRIGGIHSISAVPTCVFSHARYTVRSRPDNDNSYVISFSLAVLNVRPR